MTDCYLDQSSDTIVPIIPLLSTQLADYVSNCSPMQTTWIQQQRFSAQSAQILMLPNEAGEVDRVLLGLGTVEDFWAFAALPQALPIGEYSIVDYFSQLSLETLRWASIAFGCGYYKFGRYQPRQEIKSKLLLAPALVRSVPHWLDSLSLTRDLINTPCEDLSPSDLVAEVLAVAKEFNAKTKVIAGDKLLKTGFPCVHAVGRASTTPPHVVELNWGDEAHPSLVLIGKGVCFDSGGLDLKSAKGMLHMKKDMGGAACALGLARMIMAEQLPLRLRLIIPTVENAVSGNAYRPGDVLTSGEGTTIEVTNTDAEGRLILCDVLAAAAKDKPDLIMDFATLTGAARVAVGDQVTAMFSRDDHIANQLMQRSVKAQDEIWRLPLFCAYRSYLDSTIADIANASSTPYGGAITAALFLEHFVPQDLAWVHFDLHAWYERSRPGRPIGGAAMAIHAVFDYLQHDFCQISNEGHAT